MDAARQGICRRIFPTDASRVGMRTAAMLLAIAGLWLPRTVQAADYRTQNFIVMAPTPPLAQAVGEAAEKFRHDLAVYWLGSALPPWPTPCPIRVIAGNMPAQGVTQYNREPVRDFQMEVVGTPERILDSVLPHEVSHTVLASYFGRPLPRWADEGICTTVEHASERQKHEDMLREYLRNRRGIAMNRLFLMTEYPDDILPMYAQGYSVCQFLIAQKGPQQFVQFLGDYMARPSWTDNVRKHYGYDSLSELQEYWLAWVAGGNGPVEQFAKNTTVRPDAGQDVALASGNLATNNMNLGNVRGGSTPIAQVGSQQPQAVAGDAGSGWYERRRTDAVAATANPAARPIANVAANPAAAPMRSSDPPSIYSAAQPRPEQGAVPTRRFYGHQPGPAADARPTPASAEMRPMQLRGDFPQHPIQADRILR